MQRLEDKVSRMRFWMTIGALLIVAMLAFAAGRASGRCGGMPERQGNGGPQGQQCPPGMNCGPKGGMDQGPQSGSFQFGPGMGGNMRVIKIRETSAMDNDGDEDDGDAGEERRVEIRVVAPSPPEPPVTP